MAVDPLQERRQLHSLVDRLPPARLGAVRNRLEGILDEDGDALSPAEAKAIAEADEWWKHKDPIPHEEVLAELGLSMAKRIVWTDQAKAGIRGIEQHVALHIRKTLGRYLQSGAGATRQRKGVTPPMTRLRAQNHRVFSGTRANTWKSCASWTARKPTGKGGVTREPGSASR